MNKTNSERAQNEHFHEKLMRTDGGRTAAMKIGVRIESFRLPLAAACEKASAMGIDGIQMNSGRDLSVWTKQRINEVKSILDCYGLELSAFCGDIGGYSDPAVNVERVETFKRSLELSQQFGINVVTTHIGVVPAEDNEQRRVMWDACRKMAVHAEKCGACFAVETGPETGRILADFLKSLDSAGARVNLDPANLVMVAGDDPIDAVEALAPYIVHTHAKDGIKLDPVKDGRPYLEVPLGQGGVPFPKYLKKLREIGFDGYLAIEREVGATPEADVKLAVDFLREQLAAME